MAGYIVSDLAIDDLAEIRHYVAQDKPAAANRLIAAFFQRFILLGEQPLLGAARPEFAGGDLRVFPVGAYAIFYRVAAGNVEIARVLHGARDLGPLLES